MKRYVLPAVLVFLALALWRWNTKRPVIEAYQKAVQHGGERWTSFVI